MNWLDDFKAKTQCMGGEFGHNCEFNFLPHFKKIDKMGAKIFIEDYYTIKIELPWLSTGQMDSSFDIIIYIMTKLPGCTSVKFNKNKHQLTLEWHN